MFALWLWLSAVVVAFCAGYATGFSDRRPRRNRFIGAPDPRVHRAGSIVEFKRRAS